MSRGVPHVHSVPHRARPPACYQQAKAPSREQRSHSITKETNMATIERGITRRRLTALVLLLSYLPACST